MPWPAGAYAVLRRTGSDQGDRIKIGEIEVAPQLGLLVSGAVTWIKPLLGL